MKRYLPRVIKPEGNYVIYIVTLISTLFRLYNGVQFYWWRKRE